MGNVGQRGGQRAVTQTSTIVQLALWHAVAMQLTFKVDARAMAASGTKSRRKL